MAWVAITIGEGPAALIAEVLEGRSTPAARSTLRRLEQAAVQAVRGARKAKRDEVTPSNLKAEHRLLHTRQCGCCGGAATSGRIRSRGYCAPRLVYRCISSARDLMPSLR